MIVRTAEAEWRGGVRNGSGSVSLGSGAFEGHYSLGSRFEKEVGTNPEELLGAAHASCFAMAFSLLLAKAGYAPEVINTVAKVHIDQIGESFAITRIELVTEAKVPGLDATDFAVYAQIAKRDCPVSKALAGVEISLAAHLFDIPAGSYPLADTCPASR
jgi:osmotically inducible protein OsmC